MDYYIKQFDEAVTLKEKADVANWTLHYLVSSIVPNMRIDLIANAQAETTTPMFVARFFLFTLG